MQRRKLRSWHLRQWQSIRDGQFFPGIECVSVHKVPVRQMSGFQKGELIEFAPSVLSLICRPVPAQMKGRILFQ
jgi:hypothetical protein